jgi:hypothetical protein
MADRYQLERHGNWRFVIIDTKMKDPRGEWLLSRRAVITYSESLANVCLSALNNHAISKLRASGDAHTLAGMPSRS